MSTFFKQSGAVNTSGSENWHGPLKLLTHTHLGICTLANILAFQFLQWKKGSGYNDIIIHSLFSYLIWKWNEIKRDLCEHVCWCGRWLETKNIYSAPSLRTQNPWTRPSRVPCRLCSHPLRSQRPLSSVSCLGPSRSASTVTHCTACWTSSSRPNTSWRVCSRRRVWVHRSTHRIDGATWVQ